MADFYTKQNTNDYRKQEVLSANTTVTVWNPEAGNRLVITGLDVAKQGGATGTIRFYFEDNKWVQEYCLESTATITPRFNGIECTLQSQALRAVSPTGIWRITAYGFEVN